MNPMLEAIAKALEDYDYAMANTTDPDAQHSYADMALAAYTAGVGKMTNEQAYAIRPPWNPYNADQFVSGDATHIAAAERNRTALLALVEEPNDVD